MRWNGDGKDAGYPSQCGKPHWFQLPENLSIPIARGLVGANGARNRQLFAVLADLTH